MQMELAGNPERDQQITPCLAAEEQCEPKASQEQQSPRSNLADFENRGQCSNRDQQRGHRKSSEVQEPARKELAENHPGAIRIKLVSRVPSTAIDLAAGQHHR